MAGHPPSKKLRWDRVLLVLVLFAVLGAGTYFFALA
jgi:hypothetical protein